MAGRSGIYAIRHVASGKVYIGSAVNIRNRWRQHRRELDQGIHHSRHLQNAWHKFGPEAFAFEVLQDVEDKADLTRAEQEHIDRFGSHWRTRGYNINPTAGSPLGRRQSKEHRIRRAASAAVTKATPECRARMSDSQKEAWKRRKEATGGSGGHHVLSETRDKIAESTRRRYLDPEQRAKTARSSKDRWADPEYRAKMLAAYAARRPAPPPSDETRAKIAASMKGNRNRSGKKISAARTEVQTSIIEG